MSCMLTASLLQLFLTLQYPLNSPEAVFHPPPPLVLTTRVSRENFLFGIIPNFRDLLPYPSSSPSGSHGCFHSFRRNQEFSRFSHDPFLLFSNNIGSFQLRYHTISSTYCLRQKHQCDVGLSARQEGERESRSRRAANPKLSSMRDAAFFPALLYFAFYISHSAVLRKLT